MSENRIKEFLKYFLNHFAQIYDGLKILHFDNHSPWPTAVSGPTALGHGGSEVARGPPRAWRSAVVGHDGYRQTIVRYGGKANRRNPRRYGSLADVSYSGRFPPLYKPKISPKMS
jgi:hypothetical protein